MVEPFWTSATFVEGWVPHVLVVIIFLLAAKLLIHAEFVTVTILAAMRAKILVLIDPGDSWTLAEFVVGITNRAQGATVFWLALR
jgi:hypothetical protein